MVGPADFVLLCHARSGSNLVAWALGEHDGVEMAGEVFDGKHDATGAGLPDGVSPYRPGMNGNDFLMRYIFPAGPPAPACARGFKLFYEHARSNAPARTVWRHLIRDRSIRVIHLIRPNLFDCLVSHEVARRTDEWFRLVEAPGVPLSVAPFAISPADCQGYFRMMTSCRIWAAGAFARHPLLTIDYDELCRDFSGTMARVFDFLGVQPMALAPALQRQARCAPAQQIGNYDELRHWFRNSPFAGFFAQDHALP